MLRRQILWLGGTTLLALAAWGLWLALKDAQAPELAPDPRLSRSALTLASEDAARRAPATLAQVAASAPTAPEFNFETLQQMDRDWCTHGRVAYQQFEEALSAQSPAAPLEAPELEARMQAWPPHRAQAQVADQLRQSWVDQLMQRGDARAQATALFVASTVPQDRDAAVTQLTALARSGADPYVTALAQQRAAHCRRLAGCQVLSAAEQLARDPHNVLVLLRTQAQSSTLLQQLAQVPEKGWQVHDYRRDMLAMLLSLPGSGPPGLFSELALNLQVGLSAAWSPATLPASLVRNCQSLSREGNPEDRQACLTLANTLWDRGDSLLERGQALTLAKALRQHDHANWVARQQALDAARQEDMRVHDLFAPEPDGYIRCGWQAPLRHHLQAVSQGGEWHTLSATMGQGRQFNPAAQR